MIIERIYIEKGIRSRLCADIKLQKNTIANFKKNAHFGDPMVGQRYRTDLLNESDMFTMWYEVDNKYEKMLCYERADAFVVAILYFSILAEENIVSYVPLTDALLYQLNYVLIPGIMNEGCNLHKIKVVADALPAVEKLYNYNGTGVSCGVDSFSSILMAQQNDVPMSHQLTHVAVFNTGALNYDGYGIDIPLKKWRESTMQEFHERVALGKTIADEMKLGFIDIDSNIPEFYQGNFAFSHTVRNCSAVLATQKMWGNYYYASAGLGMVFKRDLSDDSSHYDIFTLPNISLPGLTFYSSGAEMTRLDKTKLIVDNELVQKHLNVCAYETTNCGHCVKCIRTLIALDLLGRLDDFSVSFPHQEFYKRNRYKILGQVMCSSRNDKYYYQVKQFIKQKHYHLTWKTYLYISCYPIRRIRALIKKFIKQCRSIIKNGK